MNKLVNLIVIFLSLQYLIPFIGSKVSLGSTELLITLSTAGIITLIQVIYNLSMDFSGRKEIPLKQNIFDSVFKGLIVLIGLYVIKNLESSEIQEIMIFRNSKYFKAGFITAITTVFILLRCLITP
jgi:hypothetical protein